MNDKLRGQVSEKEHTVAMLQMTISSLETRLSTMAAREQMPIQAPPPALTASLHTPSAAPLDVTDAASDALRRIAQQLIHDSEECDDLAADLAASRRSGSRSPIRTGTR